MIPGEYILASDEIVCNAGLPSVQLVVVNTGDRPVQVGSHFHFFEVNAMMAFDRPKAFGMRLNIPAGTAVRFEPGEGRQVSLVAFGGRQRAIGFNNLTDGATGASCLPAALDKAVSGGFKNDLP